MSGLDAGPYRLYAVCRAGDETLYSQAIEILLVDDDVRGVELALGPGAQVQGVVVEAKQPSQDKQQSREQTEYTVALVGKDLAPQVSVSATADTQGKFELKSLWPDHYRVQVETLDENSYVQSVVVNGSKSTDGTVALEAGESATLEIRISANGGSMSGTVTHATGSRYRVWLAPESEDLSPTELRFDYVSDKKTYSFQGLAPGTYRVGVSDLSASFDSADDLREFIHDPAAGTQVVTIKEGEQVVRDLELGKRAGQD